MSLKCSLSLSLSFYLVARVIARELPCNWIYELVVVDNSNRCAYGLYCLSYGEFPSSGKGIDPDERRCHDGQKDVLSEKRGICES